MSSDLKDLLEREAQRVRPSAVPIDAMIADGYGRVRRRRIGAGVTAAVLAVLAAFGPTTVDWLGDDGSTVDRPMEAPSWGPYRVGDTLVVEDLEVQRTRLADLLVEVPTGVVYSTESGEIVLVRRDGGLRQIGDRAGRFPTLAGDPETGWVTWLEHNGERDSEIVLYDTATNRFGEEIARLPIRDDGERNCGRPRVASYGPFAVDGGAVYYCTGEGDFVWRPTESAAPQRILPVAGDPTTVDDYLLDVRAGKQVVLRYGDGGPRTEIMPVGRTRPQTVIRRDLMDGFLSHDGRYLGSAGGLDLEVYDVATGTRVTPDYEAGQGERYGLELTFTDDGGVAFALTHPDSGEGGTNIVTCGLPNGECDTQLRDLEGGVFFANQRHQ